MEMLEIDIVDNIGVQGVMNLEFFLENFYYMDFRFVPKSKVLYYDDVKNLCQLFDELGKLSPVLRYKYFLFFHAVNAGNNARIFWEFLA